MAYKEVGEVKSVGESNITESLIELTSNNGRAKYKKNLRCITASIEVRGKIKVLKLITNNMEITAEKIAALYKKRWKIELFFKWIKQHLKIKDFFAENENGIKIQIMIALIAYILIAQLKAVCKLPDSMHLLLHWIKQNINCDIMLRKFKPPDSSVNISLLAAAL